MISNVFAFAVAVLALLVNMLAIPVARSQGYLRGLHDAMDVIMRAGEMEAENESD